MSAAHRLIPDGLLQAVLVDLMSMAAVLQDSAAQQWSLSRSGYHKLPPYVTLALKTGSL